MKYIYAKRLHNEDEVISKESGASLYVISTEVDTENKNVFVYCDDGNTYHHTEIK